MPNFGEAHCGEGAPQSQQRSLEDDFWISRSYGGQFGTGMKRSWIGIGGDKKSKTAKLQNRFAYLRPRLRIYLPHCFARHGIYIGNAPRLLSHRLSARG